jgi:hypothetical protein
LPAQRLYYELSVGGQAHRQLTHEIIERMDRYLIPEPHRFRFWFRDVKETAGQGVLASLTVSGPCRVRSDERVYAQIDADTSSKGVHINITKAWVTELIVANSDGAMTVTEGRSLRLDPAKLVKQEKKPPVGQKKPGFRFTPAEPLPPKRKAPGARPPQGPKTAKP